MFTYNRLSSYAQMATEAKKTIKKLESEDFVNSKSNVKNGAEWTKAQRIEGKTWFQNIAKSTKGSICYCQSA